VGGAQLAVLRRDRALIRQADSELEERPTRRRGVSHGWRCADDELRDYIRRHAKLDLIAAGRDDALAAGRCSWPALFSDAWPRHDAITLPDLYRHRRRRPTALATARTSDCSCSAVDCRGIVPRPVALRAALAGARPLRHAARRAHDTPSEPT
jgi:hypothetical protein